MRFLLLEAKHQRTACQPVNNLAVAIRYASTSHSGPPQWNRHSVLGLRPAVSGGVQPHGYKDPSEPL